jgi:hypothetical protein
MAIGFRREIGFTGPAYSFLAPANRENFKSSEHEESIFKILTFHYR